MAPQPGLEPGTHGLTGKALDVTEMLRNIIGSARILAENQVAPHFVTIKIGQIFE